ncbi:serine/threonine-protein phosphatase 6 regulatory ankyrin repeat subunit B-like, partial [Saccostrea cucullata]|uniref:serine/threonine-protein phosphatase 6 regulatory ankyrin repeat subunit B-like n=1 Tax=Saccostrea cuccullata TaxID=36930 RepID=UPI002ED41CE1
MNENKISENILEETNKEKVAKSFQEMKKRVLWKCKVSSETNNYKFVDALSAMEGTYTKMYGTEYSFVHDSMFEVLAYHFGCQFPELILQYMSSSYIANNVKLQQHNEHKMQNLESEHKQESENIEVCGECKEEEGNVALNGKSRENMELFDLYIRLREDQYSMLTERLYKDVENMELYDVFMNDILKEPKVCKGFIEVLKTKSYTVLKFLFLSVQKNVFKVVSKKERLDKESEGRIGKMKWPRQRFMAYRDLRGQEVLVNERKKEYKIRVISWVIYYGHNHILQFILEQTDLHKETQSELFTNSLNPELSLITEEGEANKNTEQYRLLVLSCYSGDLEIVRKILKHFNRSINLRALTNFNYEHCIYDTPLTVACMEGHINIVQELIEEGADINHQGEYNTPLTAACEGGHISVVKELIQAGADINLRGEINTPLVTASECGHKSLVTELIEMGADVNPATQFDSPLTTACVGGEISLIKELIKAGADVNPQGKYNTPLKKACLGGDLSLVKMLIEAGADVNLQDRSGPPLTACCDDRHLSIVKELLKAGAVVNQQGRFYSPLARACTDGQIGVVKVLLEKDANINTGDNLGRTPLYLTILDEPENLIPVIQILNKYGADSSICNKQGLSSLHIALLKHKNDVVNQLLRAEDERQLNKLKLHLFECLVNIRHSNVMTDCKGNVVTTQRRVWRMEELGDLYRIIRENKCDELKHLLDVGLDVNQRIELYNNINFEGFTSTYESDVRPLLFTLIDEKRVSDKVGKVLTLLEGGADVNIRVKYRESDFVLDREGVSILERIRQLMNKLRESEYWWETKDVTECERMLSEKNVFKAVSKKERLDKESEGRIGKMKWPRQRFMTYRDMRGQEVLVNERKKEYKVRVISWVIYYGHNQILQFILEQTDIHKETQSELFTNSLNPNLSLATVITEEEEAKQNIEQYRLLVLSCYSGDLGIVRKILKYFNRSINSRLLTNFNYEHCVYDTPLTVACMEGHINIVKELIEEGADINHQGEYNTPLTAACEGGHIRLVKELIQAGADINLRGEINTPLVTACECGHKSLVTDLIDMGADVNPATQFDSPLTTACVGGEMSLIKELIKAGADVNPQSKYNTPLKKACLGGDLSLVKMLIEAGADEHSSSQNKVDVVKQLLEIEREAQLNKLKLHFFNCLINIRHGGVISNSKDDVVIAQRHVWRIEEFGNLYDIIFKSECIVLKHLLEIGLDVNQLVQLYDDFNYESDVRPLLFFLIDEMVIVKDKVEKKMMSLIGLVMKMEMKTMLMCWINK